MNNNGNNPYYVTTPIYYPNGEPHLGSVYTTVICDVLARYHRLLGEPTYFLTGTDEHGTKMAKAAAAENASPQALADKYSKVFADLWEELGITNDDFIRTSESRHKQAVQKIVQKMLASGDIYLGSYEGARTVRSVLVAEIADVVDEGVNRLLIDICPLQRAFDDDIFALLI